MIDDNESLLSREGILQEKGNGETLYSHIPVEFVEMANLEKGDEVDIEVFEDCLIIHNGGI